jgi:hypothetical protein
MLTGHEWPDICVATEQSVGLAASGNSSGVVIVWDLKHLCFDHAVSITDGMIEKKEGDYYSIGEENSQQHKEKGKDGWATEKGRAGFSLPAPLNTSHPLTNQLGTSIIFPFRHPVSSSSLHQPPSSFLNVPPLPPPHSDITAVSIVPSTGEIFPAS